MQSAVTTASRSKKMRWAGYTLSALAILFLLFDAIMKLLKLAPAVEGTVRLGYPESVVMGIGVVLLACTVLYAIPRTAVLGAILLTGYLGGAVAANVRVSNPWFGYVLFPVYVGIFVWGGLFLRDPRLRSLLPMRNYEIN